MIKDYRLIRESEGVVHYAGCVNDLCYIAEKSGIDYDTMKEIERWADKHFELGDIFEIRDITVEVVDLEETMDASKMLDLLAKLPDARLADIVSDMSEKERQIVLKAVGAHKLMNDPAFYNAVKEAVASELWKRLNDDNGDEPTEVENIAVVDDDGCMTEGEVKAGLKCLKFYCPVCKRWIANAIAQERPDGYSIIRSVCSSSFNGIEKPCRDCVEKSEARAEVEVCPHCDKEVTVMWNVDKQGYRTTCPNCGEELMLCDACMNSYDNAGMRCDWSKDGGCFRHRKEQK